MRDLILKRDAELSGERYKVIYVPTGKIIGQIASEQALLSSWQWSVAHPFGECRAWPSTGRTDNLHEAMAAMARYWREAPLPERMVEHSGFVFLPFKPPKDGPWTIKITRHDAVDFKAPGYNRPQIVAWVRFQEPSSADETIVEAKHAIDNALIVTA